MPSPSPADHAANGRRPAPGIVIADVAPAFLAAVAEGAWIAILASAVVAPLGGSGPAGMLLPSVLAAVIGLAAARLLPMGGSRAPALVGLAAAVVLLGIVVGPRLGFAMADGDRAVTSSLVLAFAVLRGAAQGDPSAGAWAIETLVRRSPWLLLGAWAVGLVVAGAGRPWFVAAAAFDSLVFVVAAALASGAARRAALPADVRHDLGSNGPWLVMVGTVVGAALLLALPLAGALGGPIGSVAAAVAAGLTWLILGIAGLMATLFMVIIDAIGSLFSGLFPPSESPPPPPPPQASPPPVPVAPADAAGAPASFVEPLLAVAVIVVLVLIAWALARRWRGERRISMGGTSETRGIDLGERPSLPGLHLPRRLRALFAPDDAQTAYQRLLLDWAATPELARDPVETPAGHAARLRTEGTGETALDLLAADYQLARFGGITLTRAEQRRAIGRWRLLRGRAKGRPRGSRSTD